MADQSIPGHALAHDDIHPACLALAAPSTPLCLCLSVQGLYDGLLPHQALCCVQWALASAVPSANQHFTNMFGRIDHDLDQGLVPVSLWAR